MIDLENRETKLTNEEFNSLSRNADGDITGDLPMAYIWMTEAQVARLSGDDQSRCDDLEEELRAELAAYL
jgi:hypothetical protein